MGNGRLSHLRLDDWVVKSAMSWLRRRGKLDLAGQPWRHAVEKPTLEPAALMALPKCRTLPESRPARSFEIADREVGIVLSNEIKHLTLI